MEKRIKISLWILAILVLVILVGAVDWSPQGDVDLKNRYSIINASYINFTGGGYIYDNGTDLILGHS